MDDRSSDRGDSGERMQSACNEAVRHAVSGVLGDDDPHKPIERSGLYGYLLREMCNSARTYALAKKMDPCEFESAVWDEAVSVVRNLRWALVQDPNDKRLDFWDFGSPADKIKTGKVPYIDRSSLEDVAGDYLALPYRSQPMDRILVRVLIALELYAFGDEMMNEKTFGLVAARSPLKQTHVFLAYLRGLFINTLVFGGIGMVAFWAASTGWIGETTAGWTSATCAALFVLLGALSTFALPFSWNAQAKARGKVRELLSAMMTIYNELRSDGPISARHVRERVSVAAEEGVVWPAPLFAVLDDIVARSRRF